MNQSSPIPLPRRSADDDVRTADAQVLEAEGSRAIVDVRAIWSAIYRNRWLVIGTLVVCILLGVIVTFLSTPIYRSSAFVQIEQQGAQIIEGGEVEPVQGAQDGQRYLDTQVDIIESRSLARGVADSLGLFSSDQFLDQMNIALADEPRGSFDLEDTRREQVLDALTDNLDVTMPVDSSIATLAFSSPDPTLSARVANAYADNYIASSLERRFDTSAYARRFLEDQLAQTRQRLEESERALIDYARGAQLIDTSGGQESSDGPSSLTTAGLVQLNQSFTEATARRIEAEQRWREVSNTPLLSAAVVLDSPAVQQLMRQRSDLQAEYDQAAERYGPNYVTQVELRRQIDTLTQQLRNLARDLRDGVRQNYVIAQRQESAIENQVNQLRTATLEEQDRGVRYNILRRQVDTERGQYDALLNRYNEVSAAAGITSNNISIIDRADPAVDPVSPRPLLNLALSIVFGLVLGGALVYLREHLNDTVRSVEDMRERLGLPVLGVIPRLDDERATIEEIRDRKSEMSEAYAALRGTLLLATPQGPPRDIVVTSSGPAEGKSISALAIAHSFAQLGRRVLLIDADMRRPSLHKRFEVANELGLASMLTSQATLEESIVESGQPGLDLVTAGPIPVNPVELIAGSGFTDILERARENYDLVVIDGPPVLGLADAPALSSRVEATIFVIESNRIHLRQAREALIRLNNGRGNVLGGLMTKFSARSLGYYASDYGYDYRYGGETA